MGLGDNIPQGPTGEKPVKPIVGGLGDNKEQDFSKYTGGTELSAATNFPIADYLPWSPNGVNSRANMNLRRAQNQGMLESSAKRLGNLIPNVAGTIVESLGYMTGLLTEWGDDRDYNNILTQ